MIPYSYNMVDMGGIDLAEANGTVVPGVYEKIVEAMNLCGDLILYNWKFAGINIAPSAYTVLQQANSILINGLIQVTELDQITVIGLPPPLVPVAPLEVVENGLYEAGPPQSGFNPVQVSVPERVPIIESISITENGIYGAPEGVDGFSPVTVNVPTGGSDAYIYYWLGYEKTAIGNARNVKVTVDMSSITFTLNGQNYRRGACRSDAIDLTEIDTLSIDVSITTMSVEFGVSTNALTVQQMESSSVSSILTVSDTSNVSGEIILDVSALSGVHYIYTEATNYNNSTVGEAIITNFTKE